MKIIGLTRVRNEQEIIKDTLDHMQLYCDMVFVYDDCSTDDTVKICRQHPVVEDVVNGLKWDRNRGRAEWQNRATLLARGKMAAGQDDWFVYIDADERVDYDFTRLRYYYPFIHGIRMKLFDYYITEEDVKLNYRARKYLGPEYRQIIIAFRNLSSLDYSSFDQRQVHLRSSGTVLDEGYVKHYGKAVSVDQWEQTCDYYINHFPKYAKKWKARKGKAIHTKSDFGNELITWGEKDEKGILLTPNIHSREHTGD